MLQNALFKAIAWACLYDCFAYAFRPRVVHNMFALHKSCDELPGGSDLAEIFRYGKEATYDRLEEKWENVREGKSLLYADGASWYHVHQAFGIGPPPYLKGE